MTRPTVEVGSLRCAACKRGDHEHCIDWDVVTLTDGVSGQPVTCDCSCEDMTRPDIVVVQHEMECDRGPLCSCGADESDDW